MKSDGKHISNRSEYLPGKTLLLILFIVLIRGCTRNNEPEIPEPLSIDLITHDVTNFLGADGAIELDVTGGVLPYSYNWSNGYTTKDIEGLNAGFYSVVVTDAVDSTATESAEINQPIPDNIITDIQGNVYYTVKIGDQTWMQQNLRVTVAPDSTDITSYVYNNNSENAKTFGRLYSWDVAMNGSTADKAQGICPTGWHIPSDGEWKILEMELGMTQAEADLANVWRGQDVGTKLGKGGESGYEALYSGIAAVTSYEVYYYLINENEYIWTSTESGQNAWRRCLNKDQSTVGRYDTYPKDYAFSIRCVKDEAGGK